MQGKNWCYTINNYLFEDEEKVQRIDCKYNIYGREVGLSGTPHLQGYVVFKTNKRFETAKKIFPHGTHLEKAKGSSPQNIEYCSKSADIWTYGEAPMTQAQKGECNAKRYREAFIAAKEGRLDDIPEDMRTRHYSTYKAIMKDHYVAPPDLERLPGVWIYGPAGAGKSRKARQDYPGSYLKNAKNKWFDGYQNEESMIIDDFDKYMVSQAYDLKIWGDRYAFPAETKGGQIIIRPKIVIVTSQYHPDQIWDDEETRTAIKRRYLLVYMENGKCIVDNKQY